MSVHSESFLSLMSSYLMLLSFLSTRHSDAPYPIGLFCNYRFILLFSDFTVKWQYAVYLTAFLFHRPLITNIMKEG